MSKRPLSVTIIAWLLIVLALIGAAGLLSRPGGLGAPAAAGPIPGEVLRAIDYINILAGLICGAFMLKGADWSRVVYIGWSVIGLVAAWTIAPAKAPVILGAAVLAIFAYFLFRRKADAWFGKSWFGAPIAPGTAPPVEEEPTGSA